MMSPSFSSASLSDEPPSRRGLEALKDLRAQVAALQGTAIDSGRTTLTSGNVHLDRLLPRGGFAPGTLVEWIAERAETAAGTLAMLAAHAASQQRGGYVVVLDRSRRFYAPAAAAWGLDLRRTLVVRARNSQDEMWAIDQALRCAAIAAVWAGGSVSVES